MTRGQKIIEKIKRTTDFEHEKTLALFKSIGSIKEQGFATKEQGLKILKWKSSRPLRYYELNSDNDFEEISKIAFDSKNERVRIHMLTALNGVNYPAASAILMFYDPAQYPVIDIRVWRQLYKVGLVDTNARGQGFRLNEWVKYLQVIRELGNKMNLTARQVEKRLFDIDKEEQVGTLYKSNFVSPHE